MFVEVQGSAYVATSTDDRVRAWYVRWGGGGVGRGYVQLYSYVQLPTASLRCVGYGTTGFREKPPSEDVDVKWGGRRAFFWLCVEIAEGKGDGGRQVRRRGVDYFLRTRAILC